MPGCQKSIVLPATCVSACHAPQSGRPSSKPPTHTVGLHPQGCLARVRLFVVPPLARLVMCNATGSGCCGTRSAVPKMQWCPLLALADLFVINHPHTPTGAIPFATLCPCPLPCSALNAAAVSVLRAGPRRSRRSMVRSRTFAKPFFSSTLLYSTSVMPFRPMKGSSLRMVDGQHSSRQAKRECAPDRAIMPGWSSCTSTVTCPSANPRPRQTVTHSRHTGRRDSAPRHRSGSEHILTASAKSRPSLLFSSVATGLTMAALRAVARTLRYKGTLVVVMLLFLFKDLQVVQLILQYPSN